jgi:biopolymer transport protein ExbD
MDIFTILVFFLLVNSSDVEVLTNDKNLELPVSIAEQKPQETLVVMVSDSAILVNGRKIADIGDAVTSKERIIEDLKTELEYQASRKPYRDEEAAKLGRDVNIMADKATPYALLKKIMATCAKSEYRNIALAVSQISGEDEPLVDEPAAEG